MATALSNTEHKLEYNQWKNRWIGAMLVIGLGLSLFSWAELCVEHCSANHNYLLLGLPFGISGIFFFISLLILHIGFSNDVRARNLVKWGIASAIGAEAMFIIIQKYSIGHWCPVCLSIAASIGLAGLAYFIPYIQELIFCIKYNRGSIMKKILEGLTSCSFVVLGFMIAFFGVTKIDSVEAAAIDMKNRIAFGNKNSPVEVYFISDWFCPSCKNIEPTIEKILPEVQSKVAWYFIDFPIHTNSLNFTPYNLAFLVEDKPHYLKARESLISLTDKTTTPTDEDILEIAKKHKIHFKELSYTDVKAGIDYFDKVSDKYKISSTPTMIITNTETKEIVKLDGSNEINRENILKAIKKVSKAK